MSTWSRLVYTQLLNLNKSVLKVKLGILIGWGIFFYSASQLGSMLVLDFLNKKALAEIQSIYEERGVDEPGELIGLASETVSQKTAEDQAQKTVQQEKIRQLQQINPDIVGWIKIDNTPINYPVLQAKDNEYYLHRNYKHEEHRAGSIFMDYRNDIFAQDQHMIIYGHAMKDGSMFGQLKQFTDEDFFREHRIFTLDTLVDSYQVEIFSVYRTTIDFYYLQTEFSSQEEHASFLHTIQDRSLFNTDTTVTTEDQLLTLSTCDYVLAPKDSRLVLHGKLLLN